VLAGGDSRFTSSKLRLQRVQRGPGENDIGMVAWHMTLKTPECQQGRQVIAVANDITHQSGAFKPREDAVFRAAGRAGTAERLPLVYLAANNGARVGVATEVSPAACHGWHEVHGACCRPCPHLLSICFHIRMISA